MQRDIDSRGTQMSSETRADRACTSEDRKAGAHEQRLEVQENKALQH